MDLRFCEEANEVMENSMKKVFIVEDDIALCGEFERELQGRNDYVYSGMADGATKAIEQVKNNVPDIIILDLCLNERDGTAFVTELHKYFDILPTIIVISVIEDDKVIEKLYKMGVDYRFSKHEEEFGVPLIIEHLEMIHNGLRVPKLKVACYTD